MNLKVFQRKQDAPRNRRAQRRKLLAALVRSVRSYLFFAKVRWGLEFQYRRYTLVGYRFAAAPRLDGASIPIHALNETRIPKNSKRNIARKFSSVVAVWSMMRYVWEKKVCKMRLEHYICRFFRSVIFELFEYNITCKQ
jgi:hypothetical protein